MKQDTVTRCHAKYFGEALTRRYPSDSVQKLDVSLAEALCKLEGCTCAPSETLYWQHGHSSNKSFVYVTAQYLIREQLTQLNDEVGPGRSLLICCGAIRGKPESFPYLEIKKIPKAVLAKCKWGHDDYSFKVENLSKAPPPNGQQELELF